MKLYHGSNIPVYEPQILVSDRKLDFGTGFYLTSSLEQAERWARRNETPVVSCYDVRLDDTLDIVDFKTMTDEWLDFIVSCRSGVKHAHDIVIGAMANDQIYNYVGDFIDGAITRDQFWSLMKFKYPTHQIVFCTPQALQCLRFRGSEVVHD